jgi:peptidoglycan hydrolase CwlO-like protein
MSEERIYNCRVCDDKDVVNFYDKRFNVCKSCYSKKMSLSKEKSKAEISEFKKKVENLEKVVEELRGEIESLKSERSQ